ncbi:putative peptide modification system cyclase [Xanthomonas sp. A2111]|uniref:Peptide modification system cyclase n=1 Tax=Xanthomonas hawaiiensis TaxID=3003247 RepID=A0ABU2I5L1_9XANT|nr:putative peptide modification system cyclase [Xanthomonas sp. A2111]MBO9829725.1 putative peptide modification system cyclase [Xanthomonas sp. A2111]MDS9993418.1 putative peptide modification system cyclase [Xanthomonas sp. A2111]
MTDAIAPPPEVPQLRTLLLTDLCDSVALVEKLGDATAAELFKRHDSLVLELQQRWRGRLIDRSDGLLLLFERPIDGLGFALDYSRGLRDLGAQRKLDLKVRAGLHVGEVLTWRNSDAAVQVGAKPLEVEGLAKPTAARLMTLARPGQILLSAVAESLTHRAARELGERGERLLWKSHGRWRFKGVPTPLEIYEVGEIGHTPLRAPKPTPKAWRDIPLWRRPAALAAEVALIAACAAGIWFVTRPQPAIAFAERDWVVVGDLRNLTGNAVLNETLEQAFRISLEQSRYVNVVSDMKVQDTLVRMRESPTAMLDRAIASEVAERDGARAVLLPTVAEIGGRLRVSVDVVDPSSGTTVLVVSKDGKGLDSALASIDDVAAQLRGKLGEAMDSIAQSSQPLPQVATPSIDALRAYSLGVTAYARKENDLAIEFFTKALEMDQGFSLAHAAIMRIYTSRADFVAAQKHLSAALSHIERLPKRDQLYLQAWKAQYFSADPQEAARRWKLLSQMYPDYYAGAANYAWLSMVKGDYAEAAKYSKIAATPQNPLRGYALEQLARAELANDRVQESLENFQQAEREFGSAAGMGSALALAASGDLTAAQKIVEQRTSGHTGQLFSSDIAISVVVATQSGNLQKAESLANEQATRVKDESELLYQDFKLLSLSVQVLDAPNKELRNELFDYSSALISNLRWKPDTDKAEYAVFALASVYLLQRAGGERLPSNFSELIKLATTSNDATVRRLATLVQARQLVREGQPLQAAALLRPGLDGSELFQARIVMREALAAMGDTTAARIQDNAIARTRGRAYAEVAVGSIFQPLNIADIEDSTRRIRELEHGPRRSTPGL